MMDEKSVEGGEKQESQTGNSTGSVVDQQIAEEVLANASRLQSLLAINKEVYENKKLAEPDRKGKADKKLRKVMKAVEADLANWSPKLKKARKKGNKEKVAIYSIRVEALSRYAHDLKKQLLEQ